MELEKGLVSLPNMRSRAGAAGGATSCGCSIIKRRGLVQTAVSTASLAWGVKDDLRKLGETLELIQALIVDAEEKQITDATVRLWLRRLKHVVYNVDDVMDEFCYATTRHCERGSQLKHKVRDFISRYSNSLVFQFKMAGKIRAIKKRLDEIYNDRVRYTLDVANGTSPVDQIREQRNRLTTSFVNDSVLMGREDEKSDLVNMLTDKTLLSMSPSSASSHNSSHQEQLSVVSIVGMGGLGKTTLAQLVYQNESIKTHFQQKMWVCISDKFDVCGILKQIQESITGVSCGDLSNVDVLVRQVKENLTGKKYLLVLDDLWNEDAEDWGKLKGFLTHGVKGSKLLVTTRSQKVASVVGGKVHNLRKLTDDVCWSIMQKKISFSDEAVLTQHMLHIGREIAKKCDGLPLAANFLGNLLHFKGEERYWVSINNDKNLWVQPENTRVMSILKLSYDSLPSALKQCFSYCCIFPKDREIQRQMLIRMWMAEGFLELPNEVNNRSYEDIGNDYFEYLLFNSFFQDVEKDEIGVVYKCKIHDLVHDLAMSVVDRNEFGMDEKVDVSKVRRLQLICDNESSTSTAILLSKASKLRTFIVLGLSHYTRIDDFFSTKRLRVLHHVGGCPNEFVSQYTTFSFSVSKLKYLRFLDLSNCEIKLSNDVSLNHSHNLQTLILHGCRNVFWFLGETGHLKNLRHLDVSNSDIKLLPDDSIANLTNLQTLDIHRCSEFIALPENIGLLKHLSYLNLSYSSSIKKIPDSITCISNLETLSFQGCKHLDALPEELGSLTRLRCLDLSDTNVKVLPESCINHLWNLEIMDFGSSCELPKEIKNWPKLRHFRHCRYFDIMPRGMGKLTCLETLKSYVPRKEADIQVCGSGSTQNNCLGGHSGLEELATLNSLEVLYLVKIQNARGIEDAESAKLKDKPNLRELILSWNGDVDMVLEGLRPHTNLRMLEIFQFSGLKLPKWMGSSLSNCLLPNLVSLRLSCINRCEKLPALGRLPSLRDLHISDMDAVKCLGIEFYYQQQEIDESKQNPTTTTSSLFPSLLHLKISDMVNLEEWVSPPPPSYLYVDSFPLLEKLEIWNCPKLRSAPNSFPSLKELNLSYTNGKAVNSIISASRGGCLASLTSIVIDGSPELIYLSLAALEKNAPNLHSLEIKRCYEFQGFQDDDHPHLNSNNNFLHSLNLSGCPVLTMLPDLRLWTSLRELVILNCNKLKESIPYDFKTSLSFLNILRVDSYYYRQQKHQSSGDFELH